MRNSLHSTEALEAGSVLLLGTSPVSQMTIRKTMVEVGTSVWAEAFIPAECESPVVQLATSISTIHSTSNPKRLKVRAEKNQLVFHPHCGIADSWPLWMEVAGECRTQNVECVLVSTTSLMFTTTRPIEADQQLFFWFSETLLARLEMPFLAPANIQGGERYVCHRCACVFTTPNPLKLHLFFNCSPSITMTSLWNRIHHILHQQLEPPPPPPMTSIFLRQVLCSAPTVPSPVPHQSWPQSTPAQVESLVSHLGRSKHGHVCIYCGKIYSRKYGLKIHIRTHTGYKPLQCPVCSRPFGDPSNLNKHIRLHSEGDTPYKCEFCGKILVRRRDLERHLKSRHPSERNAHRLRVSDPNTDDDDDDDEDIDIC